MTNTHEEYDTMIIAQSFDADTQAINTWICSKIAREFEDMPLGEVIFNAMKIQNLI